jgi:hypothetical protein
MRWENGFIHYTPPPIIFRNSASGLLFADDMETGTVIGTDLQRASVFSFSWNET